MIDQLKAQFPSAEVTEGKWGLEVRVPAADLLALARWVKTQGFTFPNCVSAVDRLDEGFEVYTHLSAPETGAKLTLVVKAPNHDPTVPSLMPVWA
ncbi:MAG: NADH-quinone oxidoreductase subunit C, partial [Deinococcus sp.]|nr:NADH-quinone oxidoreductase subunit C [Deinococcus sp.]